PSSWTACHLVVGDQRTQGPEPPEVGAAVIRRAETGAATRAARWPSTAASVDVGRQLGGLPFELGASCTDLAPLLVPGAVDLRARHREAGPHRESLRPGARL